MPEQLGQARNLSALFCMRPAVSGAARGVLQPDDFKIPGKAGFCIESRASFILDKKDRMDATLIKTQKASSK